MLQDAPETIRNAQEQGDADEAARLAHTLKGAAGMIEAGELRDAARALEQALRSASGGWNEVVDGLAAGRGRMLRDIDGLVR